jgi:hypothetical protein
MITRNLQVVVVMAAVSILLATSGCIPTSPQVRVGELQSKSQSIALDNAPSEYVDLNIAAGELIVSGGASQLLDAKFTYNVAELEPQVAYSGGKLSVHTPALSTGVEALWNLKDYRHKWDLRLNDNVPMKMSVETGAASADLKLGSLALKQLELERGVGPVVIDLTGNWNDDLDAKIGGGLGGLTLRLPRSTCVRVDVEGGLGRTVSQDLTKNGSTFVNAACGKSKVTLHIDVSGGAGNVTLEVGE